MTIFFFKLSHKNYTIEEKIIIRIGIQKKTNRKAFKLEKKRS